MFHRPSAWRKALIAEGKTVDEAAGKAAEGKTGKKKVGKIGGGRGKSAGK